MKAIHWAILGTGVVANEMAVALTNAGKEIYAVGNRTQSKAVEFAQNMEFKKYMMIFMKCLRTQK